MYLVLCVEQAFTVYAPRRCVCCVLRRASLPCSLWSMVLPITAGEERRQPTIHSGEHIPRRLRRPLCRHVRLERSVDACSAPWFALTCAVFSPSHRSILPSVFHVRTPGSPTISVLFYNGQYKRLEAEAEDDTQGDAAQNDNYRQVGPADTHPHHNHNHTSDERGNGGSLTNPLLEDEEAP